MKSSKIDAVWRPLVAVGVVIVLLSAPLIQNPELTAFVIGGMLVVVGCSGAIVAAIRELGARGGADDNLSPERVR